MDLSIIEVMDDTLALWVYVKCKIYQKGTVLYLALDYKSRDRCTAVPPRNYVRCRTDFDDTDAAFMPLRLA